MIDRAVTLRRAELDIVRFGAAVVVESPAVFRFEGSGAVQVLQGLLTNDIEKPGNESLIYGALLTPKGMIVFDVWAARANGDVLLFARPEARGPAAELFQKSVPPRLARVTDQTSELNVAWLIGAQAFQTLARAGLGPLPDSAGRVTTIDTVRGRLVVGLPPDGAPFGAMMAGPEPALGLALDLLGSEGGTRGDPRLMEAARILSGWPALGAEIGERTLPQEVRFDAIGGVSYTKGCYVGQETVARVHFRGHTNRELRGLRWDSSDAPEGYSVVNGDREVGAISSMLVLDDRTLGLAVLRREVATGDTVSAGDRLATVVSLPFADRDIDG